MKIIEPSWQILTAIDGEDVLCKLEIYGRTCYKSECKITMGSAKTFVQKIMKSGHHSVIEHFSFSVRFVCDRGVSHELVRHRIASYSQESTRYCNYGKQGEVVFIKPCFWEEDSREYREWKVAMQLAEGAYMQLLSWGCTPQQARSVLPNSLKTELVMTANLRSWHNFFRLRTDVAAHPQMRQLAVPLFLQVKRLLPVIFDDIQEPVWPK